MSDAQSWVEIEEACPGCAAVALEVLARMSSSLDDQGFRHLRSGVPRPGDRWKCTACNVGGVLRGLDPRVVVEHDSVCTGCGEPCGDDDYVQSDGVYRCDRCAVEFFED